MNRRAEGLLSQAIRRKATQETQHIKEELQKKEQLKEAAAKRREKQEEIKAKERIRAKIKADAEERRLKAEKAKAERDGRAAEATQSTASAAAPSASGPPTSKPAAAYTETRLRLQTPAGTIQKSFAVDATLFEVAAAVEQENGVQAESITVNFPKKTFQQGVDFGQTLKEAGLVPSAALILK